MDPLKLLSRSTKRPRTSKDSGIQSLPSSGRQDTTLIRSGAASTTSGTSRKRKRKINDVHEKLQEPSNFFGGGVVDDAVQEDNGTELEESARAGFVENVAGSAEGLGDSADLPLAECRRILQQHKLKVTRLRPTSKVTKRAKRADGSSEGKKEKDPIYPQPLLSFDALETQYRISSRLAGNIRAQGYSAPTEVQLAGIPLLLNAQRHSSTEHDGNAGRSSDLSEHIDLLSIAPTGSGKTLAFLIPLLDSTIRHRQSKKNSDRHISAVILAPTKELAAQIVNEGRKLAKDTGVTITQMRKGMHLGHGAGNGSDLEGETTIVMKPARNDATVVKSDVIVSTPGLLQSALLDASGIEHLSDVRHLVLDEADVLLDPLFKDQTQRIWNALTHPSLRVSLWSATMGSNIEELARSTINARRQQLELSRGEDILETSLIRLVVGLKDSAAPNVEHKLVYSASEQGKLMGLRQLLHPTSSLVEAGPILRPPFLIFTQTIERAVALHSELRYDIPAEAGGISRIAVLHADLSATTRGDVMTKFRQGSIWILITTDLLSRGVDFRGVNGVVNYDIPGSSAAYIHRIGRTGRAGRAGGVAVTFYSKDDMPYLKHIANVVAMAQRQKGEESGGVQQWLLDALPRLSKNEKQALKKHGVKSRTAKANGDDSKASRRTKISTKAGFVRQAENKRKGAILGSQRRAQAGSDSDSDAGNDKEFAGFD